MTGKPARLLSLDALRGTTIIAMIVVNTPGSWATIYAPFRHASWHGLTPTDLVFPFFLFIVGVSIALAYARAHDAETLPSGVHRKVLWRSFKIFVVGLFLNLWPTFAFAEMRVAGVLQRIAVVFFFAALLYLHLSRRMLGILTVALLLISWGLLTLVPVPRDTVVEHALETGQAERAWGATVEVDIEAISDGTIAPNLEPATNLAAWLDRHFLPGRLYEKTWDPEGWLGTLNALATTLLGVLTGILIRRVGKLSRQAQWLTLSGGVLLALGYAWSTVLPMNKNLWTSSYTLVAAGWAQVGFAAALWLVDGRGWKAPAWPGIVLGANAISAYVLAGMLTVINAHPWLAGKTPAQWCMEAVTHLGGSAELASLVYALGYTTLIFLPIWWLYRMQILIKL